MLAINSGEVALLALWAVGVVSAIYATSGADVAIIRRVIIVLIAVFIPVIGSLLAIGLAVARFWRNHHGSANAKAV